MALSHGGISEGQYVTQNRNAGKCFSELMSCFAALLSCLFALLHHISPSFLLSHSLLGPCGSGDSLPHISNESFSMKLFVFFRLSARGNTSLTSLTSLNFTWPSLSTPFNSPFSDYLLLCLFTETLLEHIIALSEPCSSAQAYCYSFFLKLGTNKCH